MKRIALVPAAGTGKRMGAGVNKQYLLLAGRPILVHTLELLASVDCVDEIYPIVPAAELDYCRSEVVEKYGIAKIGRIIAGGAERQQSVLNGLRGIEANPEDIILIHDGVRPFVPLPAVAQSVAMAREHGGAVVAVPVKDTVKVVEDAYAVASPPRETLWLAQTPQTFRYDLIRSAHEQALLEGFIGTDDASLLERIGRKVRVVIGDYRNIKITTPDDLILAEAFFRTMPGDN